MIQVRRIRVPVDVLERQATTTATAAASATATRKVSREVRFRRRVEPLPDGRVKVRIQVWRGGRKLGTIAQYKGGWKWMPEGKARAGKVWGMVFRTAEECKTAVRKEIEEGR